MPRRTFPVLTFILVAAASAAAPEPTAEQIRTLQSRYRQERTAATEPPEPAALNRADAWAARGDTALSAGQLRNAAAAFRAARFQLPAKPAGLPPHVARILGSNRLRCGDRVSSLAFSPDGDLLASASRDGVIRLWDAGSGREVRQFRGHVISTAALVAKNDRDFRGPVVALSPDGQLVASAGGEEISLWETATGREKQKLPGHPAFVTALAFSPDGKLLASAGDDKMARLWDVAAAKEVAKLGPQQTRVQGVAFGQNGKLLAAVNFGGSLTVWNVATPEKPAQLVTQPAQGGAASNAIAFSPDGTLIATVGIDQQAGARLYHAPGPDGNAPDGKSRLFIGQSGAVNAVAFSPDGKTLVTAGNDKTVFIWDVATQKPLRTFAGHADPAQCLAVSPDGAMVASGGDDQSIRIWPLNPEDTHRRLDGARGPVWAVVTSPDGKQIATAGADRVIRLYDAASAQLKSELKGHGDAVTALAYSPDGKYLLSAGGDKLVKVWDAAAGSFVRDLAGHEGPVLAVAWRPNSSHAVSGGADKAMRVWDVPAGRAVRTQSGFRAAVCAVAASPDGKLIAAGAVDGTGKLFDAETGQEGPTPLPALHGAGVAALAFAPDGKSLASAGGDRRVRLWTVASGPTLIPAADLTGHTGPVSALAFSADGRLLVSAGADTVVRVWNLATRTESRGLRGHTDWVGAVALAPDGTVLSGGVDGTVRLWDGAADEPTPLAGHTRQVDVVAVSPDGRRLASGAIDRAVKLWDRATGAELRTLLGHEHRLSAISFSPDGKRLATAGYDKRIRLWDTETGQEVVVVNTVENVPLLQFVADGKEFATWEYQGGVVTVIRLHDAATGKETGKPIEDREYKAHCVAFSADGALAALGNANGGVQLWRLRTAQALGEPLAVAAKKAVIDLALNADATTLVTGDVDGELKVWDVAKREVRKSWPARTKFLRALVLSADGKRLATTDELGVVRLWDVADGTELRSWELPAVAKCLAFTPDGRQLLTGNEDGTLGLLELP